MNALKNKWVWFGAGLIIGIPVVAFGWWLLAPLFLDTEVDEAFPLTENADDSGGHFPIGGRDRDDDHGEGRDQDGRGNAQGDDGGLQRRRGVRERFRDGDSFHKGEGKATIYKLADGQQVLRFEDFKVTNGPDLRVLLVKNANPQGRGDLDSGYEELGKLKGNIGNQNYTIPNSIDLDEYGSIVIYCKPFHVVFSVASLN